MQEPDRDGEWAKSWPLVLTSLLGVSLGTIGTYSAGLFVAPLEAEFGWTRAQVTSGLLIYALVAVPLSPFVGVAIDRWGARRLAIPGSIATGIAFAGFAFTNGASWLWWSTWALFSLAALTVKTTVWTTAIVALFDRWRGLALAIALSGAGLASGVLPALTEALIAHIGWRGAYAVIGLGWAAATAALSYAFFVDARAPRRGERPPEAPGLSFREAIGLRSFQLLWAISLLGSTLLIGLTVHLVPMLVTLGFARSHAAAIVGAAGVGTIVGKLISGFVFDSWSPKLAGAAFQALPSVACALLLQPRVGPYAAILAVFLVGYTSGAGLTMASFMTARLVGLRAYGANFSIIASMLALATGLGPWLCGVVYDSSHSYRAVLVAGLAIPVACSLLTLCIRLKAEPDAAAGPISPDLASSATPPG
jgi:predicted MFS family arabinose efflux permease